MVGAFYSSSGRYMVGSVRYRLKPLLSLLILGLVHACGDDGGTDPFLVTTITKLDGDQQQGRVGQILASPIRVVVTEDGAPIAGATITWSTTAEGANLSATSTTDASGVASNSWTLGTNAGSQTAQATLAGASGSPVSFTATALPAAAVSLSQIGGTGQIGEINSPLAEPLQVKVADQFGNGVPGVDVAWSASGVTVSAPSVPTDESGVSAVTVTLGPDPGVFSVSASAIGLTGSPTTFEVSAEEPQPIPTSASVQVGNTFFTSDANGTSNPAVDTVAVGGTVTWTWVPFGGTHNVRSTGSPSFTDSQVMSTGSYSFTFTAPGAYTYDCVIHGSSMTGRVVVR
jgi:plastocyanin